VLSYRGLKSFRGEITLFGSYAVGEGTVEMVEWPKAGGVVGCCRGTHAPFPRLAFLPRPRSPPFVSNVVRLGDALLVLSTNICWRVSSA